MKIQLTMTGWAVAGSACTFLWPIFLGSAVLQFTGSFWLSILGGAASFLLVLAGVPLTQLFLSRR